MSKKVNHVHLYKKVNLSRKDDKPYIVYKCLKPVCSHYIPLHLAEGKLCECYRCGNPFILTKLHLAGSNGRAMTRPHCIDCVRRRKSADVDALTDYFKDNEI